MSSTTYRNDPCSQASAELYQIKHIDFNWSVDFDKRILSGTVDLHFIRNVPDSATAEEIVLDTRDLSVHDVIEVASNTQLPFKFGEPNANLGTSLHIDLRGLTGSHASLNLRVTYETSPNSTALQWLGANQTLGKRHPYLFSQCQAIHARALYPCQDTPIVKFTYNAQVRARKPFVVLMSAVRNGSGREVDAEWLEYSFVQNQPIPSYLLAIVVGDIVSKPIGPRSHVWTEKELVDDAANEFADTEEMIRTAESIVGEYVWGQYDILVLPPTFPYGGMENPCLTFATPALVVGDRSLADVIIHEISHSWTGNLVTNRTWEHFWLNEGYTMFLQRKIFARMNNSELYRQFDCLEGFRDLRQAVEDFGASHEFTKLVPNLDNTNPDDAFSTIPYEKGHTLLFYLESILGGPEVFDKYLRAYIEQFKNHAPIDSYDWKNFLYEYFSDKKDVLDTVDWNAWLHAPGLPPVEPKFDTTLADECTKLRLILTQNDVTGVDPLFEKFSTAQIIELIGQLWEHETLSHEKLEALNQHYKFGSTRNCEILLKWLRIGIKARWEPIIAPALKFATEQGRMKYTRPVYRDMYNWESVRQATIDNFLRNRQFMHQTTAGLVAKDLKLE